MNDIDAKELVKGNKEMLMKVIWQIIKIGLETKMKKNQNLIKKFMDRSDDMENMVRLAADKLILKWVSGTLKTMTRVTTTIDPPTSFILRDTCQTIDLSYTTRVKILFHHVQANKFGLTRTVLYILTRLY